LNALALKGQGDWLPTQGVLSPLLVRPLNERSFEIVVGARRFRAAQMADATVPVRIVHLTDAQAAQRAKQHRHEFWKLLMSA
jgi:ParB family transcriptional regulator, chromosome partitioning protein